ncbi:MAG: ATP synthase F1 subunit epsilon [Actinomycetota bacterium]|nr:ATP synthase F1 subunit epsilon [Actinomycetota bacterium]
MPIEVDLVSPERILFSGEADMVVCRTIDGGEVAFLQDHVPFLAALEIASARIKKPDGDYEVAAVHGGFVHVKDNKVVILSDVAEMKDQIDEERARRAKDDADQRQQKEEDDTEAEAALRRAQVRLEVAERS